MYNALINKCLSVFVCETELLLFVGLPPAGLLTWMTSVSQWSDPAVTRRASLYLSTFPRSCQRRSSSSSLRLLVTRDAHHAEPAPGHSLSACSVGNGRLFPLFHWTKPLSVGVPRAELRPPLRLAVC